MVPCNSSISGCRIGCVFTLGAHDYGPISENVDVGRVGGWEAHGARDSKNQRGASRFRKCLRVIFLYISCMYVCIFCTGGYKITYSSTRAKTKTKQNADFIGISRWENHRTSVSRPAPCASSHHRHVCVNFIHVASCCHRQRARARKGSMLPLYTLFVWLMVSGMYRLACPRVYC